MTKVSMTVNGRAVSGEVEGRTLLVEFLREGLGLTGTHVGCDTSQCGACVVHVDGQAVKSCTIFAAECDGAKVTTIEGMANADGSLGTIQQAFQDHHGLQCGFCTPGMVMSAAALLEDNPKPSEAEIRASSGRQHLPLHRLPQHRQGDPCRVRPGRAASPRNRPAFKRTDFIRGGMDMPDGGIGASTKRREDLRFLTGNGRYTDDINLRGQSHVVFVRSDVAHGKLISIDTEAAAAMPGVVRIFTAADFEGVGGIPCGWQITDATATRCWSRSIRSSPTARSAMSATRSRGRRRDRGAGPRRRREAGARYRGTAGRDRHEGGGQGRTTRP